MQLRLAAGLTGVFVAAALVGAAEPASADIGDSIATCNSGEICLNRANPGGIYQRHFWHGGNDDGTWSNTSTTDSTSWKVQDDASSLRNRDTACDVIEVDYRGSAIRSRQTFARGASSFVGFTDALNDENDAHWRCRLDGA